MTRFRSRFILESSDQRVATGSVGPDQLAIIGSVDAVGEPGSTV
jgi:hypothetical protein